MGAGIAYSPRKARIGATRAARRAGSRQARKPATASTTQYFPAIGLLPTDIVVVTKAGAQTAAVGILDARVSATDTLAIKFLATAGTPTPAAGTTASPYSVTVFRVQPYWAAPATGNQIDW